MGNDLYDIEFSFGALQSGVGFTITEAQFFGVMGGKDREIYSSPGINNISEAEIMAEFYQARHFQNVYLQKWINRASLEIDKLYYEKLSFSFNLVISNKSKSARFRSLALFANDGRISKPIKRDSRRELLQITFSDPKLDYFYQIKQGNKISINQESL